MRRAISERRYSRKHFAISKYLDKLIVDSGLTLIDLDRNKDIDLLRLVFGQQVFIYELGVTEKVSMKIEQRLMTPELYEVFYELCL
jgi:hypothetical protein